MLYPYSTGFWKAKEDWGKLLEIPFFSPEILLPVVNFTERKRIKSPTRFGAKSTENLKICMKTIHFLLVFFDILAPF